MSKIKLTGSNSGYVEIDSAADAGNLTLQLPTSGTRLLSDAGNVFTGITTTGELDVNGKIDVSTDIVLGRNLKVTGITTLSNDVILKGGSYDVLWDSSDNALEFGTNAKATFGGAMQLYHDGSNSLIQDSGTGHVQVRSGTFTVGNAGLTKTSAIFNSGSGQQLNFNNNQKFITTNTGVVVTGICTATSFSGDGANLTGLSTPLSFRNKIINGSQQIFQRGTSATSDSASLRSGGDDGYYYGIGDMWAIRMHSSVAQTGFAKDTSDNPEGFGSNQKLVRSNAGSSNAGKYFVYDTKLEGQDLQDFAKGTSSAKEFTLSFYVKTGVSGVYCIELRDLDNARMVGGTYTVSNGNWNRYVITFPADTTGKFDNDNGASLWVRFWLAAGSSFTSGTARTTWGSVSGANLAVGQTAQVGDNVADTWQITGVQLEVGSVATPFEHRSAGDELIRCQRYYQQYVNPCCTGVIPDNGSKAYSIGLQFQTRMRAVPTLAITNAGTGGNVSDGQSTQFISALNAADRNVDGASIYLNLAGDLGDFRPACLGLNDSTTNSTTYKFTAEL